MIMQYVKGLFQICISPINLLFSITAALDNLNYTRPGEKEVQ